MNPALLGFLRGLGFAVLMVVISYFEDVNHLTGILNPTVAGVLSALALALEHAIQANTGKALFGAVRA